MTRWRELPEIAAALAILDAGRVREAHEAFEDVWRAHRGSTLGEVARALSQWAAACVHLEAERESGFQSLAAKSAERLSSPAVSSEHETQALADWIRAVAREPRSRSLRPTRG